VTVPEDSGFTFPDLNFFDVCEPVHTGRRNAALTYVKGIVEAQSRLRCCLVEEGIEVMNSMMRRIRSFPLALLLGVTSFVHVSGSLAQTVPTDSRTATRDTQFKVYFGTRDGQLALIGEIKRLQNYHEIFRTKLKASLNDYSKDIDKALADVVEPAKNSITVEIERTKNFANEYGKTKDEKLIEDFDSKYPINYKEILRGDRTGFTVINGHLMYAFLRLERSTTAEVFRNISNEENKRIFTEYDNLFNKMDTDFENLERPGVMNQLNALPTQFSLLAHKDRSQSMSAEDVSVAVNRYLDVLNNSFRDLTAFGSNPEAIKANIEANTKIYLADTDKIGEEIATLLRKANYQLDTIESSIAESARALYGISLSG